MIALFERIDAVPWSVWLAVGSVVALIVVVTSPRDRS